MSAVELINFSFSYPGTHTPVLSDVTLRVMPGEFVLLCGETGSGKTTLLRSMKPEIAPVGRATGEIRLFSQPADKRKTASEVGFVSQNPDNQLVLDTVRSELAFGLENLNTPPAVIRRKMAEIVSFFGMEALLERGTHTLSGGQKQLLNLAAVMVMQPAVLLLDEPAAQLDPVAAKSFFAMLQRISDELGTTIILSEHRLEEPLSLASRVVFLERGGVTCYRPPEFAAWLHNAGHPFAAALPAPARAALRMGASEHCPLNVKSGRAWLASQKAQFKAKRPQQPVSETEPVLEGKGLWYRYGTKENFVVRDTNLSVNRGEIHALLGGNGSGKTTLLHLLCGVYQPNRGRVRRKDGLRCGLLSQNPDALFTRDTVYEELCEWRGHAGYSEREVDEMLAFLRLSPLRERHPYDLSGGEKQRAALAKLLLLSPDILLLDEPTKGIDAAGRRELCGILSSLKAEGKTIFLVTHNAEFAAEAADRCSMLFDGGIVCTEEARAFFTANLFYTTETNRMTRGLVEGCVLEEDLDYA